MEMSEVRKRARRRLKFANEQFKELENELEDARATRDERIAAARIAGLSWKEIGEVTGLFPNSIRSALRRAAANDAEDSQ